MTLPCWHAAKTWGWDATGPWACKIEGSENITLPMMLQGYFRVLNFFDVAEAIDLDKLRALLGPEAAPRPPAFRHRTPEYSHVQQRRSLSRWITDAGDGREIGRAD